MPDGEQEWVIGVLPSTEALMAYGFHHEHVRSIHEQLERTGLVRWIQRRTAKQRHLARAQLKAAEAWEILPQTGS